MQLSKRLENVRESATLGLNALAKELALAGKPVVNLTAGELDFETPKEVSEEAAKYLHLNKYTPNLGTLELRQAIAKSLNRKHQQKLKTENIAVTAGAKQGLFVAFQTILNPGDEVIIPLPGWVSYENQVRLCGARSVLVPLTKNFDLDVEAIQNRVTSKTKAILLNSPHNPTGSVFNPYKMKNLLAFGVKKKIFIIADEIYSSLTYGKPFTSVLKMRPDFSSLILVDGFSKSHALTGWRIGYVVANPNIIAGFNKILSHISGNASVVSQRAALACVNHPEVTSRFVSQLKKRRNVAVALLKKIKGISFTMPEGAFYFFIDVRKVTESSQKCAKLLLSDHGLAVVPGEAFGYPGFLRMSFAASEAEIREGTAILKDFFETKY